MRTSTLKEVIEEIVTTLRRDVVDPHELVDVCKWALMRAQRNELDNPEPSDDTDPTDTYNAEC